MDSFELNKFHLTSDFNEIKSFEFESVVMVRRIVIILIIIGDVISAVYCANIEHGNYGQSPQNGLQFGNSRNENNGYMHNFNQRTELPTYSPTETVKPRQTTGSSDKEEIDKVETKKLKELRCESVHIMIKLVVFKLYKTCEF